MGKQKNSDIYKPQYIKLNIIKEDSSKKKRQNVKNSTAFKDNITENIRGLSRHEQRHGETSCTEVKLGSQLDPRPILPFGRGGIKGFFPFPPLLFDCPDPLPLAI